MVFKNQRITCCRGCALASIYKSLNPSEDSYCPDLLRVFEGLLISELAEDLCTILEGGLMTVGIIIF